jgi:hypothetical protein
MEKVYISIGFEVAGRTPIECLTKVCNIVNTQKYFLGTNNAIPVEIIKQDKDWMGKTVYQGVYKGIDIKGKKVIRKTKIVAYEI